MTPGFGGEDVYYYLTIYNEPMVQPAEPEDLDVEGLLKGIYRVDQPEGDGPHAQILASGVGLPWARRAREILAEQWGVSAGVWSVTSWSELRRDGIECERDALRDPSAEPRIPYLQQVLAEENGPFVAVSDWMRQVPDQIRQWIPGDYTSLGTDGFGFSDTREGARRFFNVDAESVVVAVLQALAHQGSVDRSAPVEAARRYRIAEVLPAPEQNADVDVD